MVVVSRSQQFVIYCKSFSSDLEAFRRMFASYRQHNKDNIPLYVSVPSSDEAAFKQIVGSEATVIADESYAESYFTTEMYWNLSLGYINQEICKLSFWETGIAKNYLCVDSDAYFIRDFYKNDFMATKSTPYSVLVMDKDLNTQEYYREFGRWRLGHIKRIFEEVGYDDRRYLTCHGMTVLSSAVLKDFKKNFLRKKKISYKDLIKISPYEYSWYNAWLQKSKIIDVVAVEPFFKTFHMRKEYQLSRISMIKEADIAEYYVGIIMNSNWKPIPPPVRYRDPGMVCEKIYQLVDKLK